MEPRPTSPRSSQGQPAGAGHPSEETRVYSPQSDPATSAAPQRSDYDYSPLDLAPPGQRRRRQLVAALIGVVVVLLLIGAAAFAIVALTGDDDGDEDVALLQAQIATMEAGEIGTPDITEEAGDEVAVAESSGEQAAGEGEASAPTEEADEVVVADPSGEQAGAQPTEPPAQEAVAGGPSQADLEAMLPDPSAVPQGLDVVENTTRTQQEVLAALGNNREAETNLANWGWTANVERTFTASDPAALPPDATTNLTASLHGFATDQAAAEALTFSSDILLGLGYEEVEVGDIGATNRMLAQPQEDGGTTVALYVQQGPVLYRIGGYSPGGDPTTNVINVAQAMLSQ